ncbi:MAG: hypothetical protein LBN27_04845 [Prevotellaceae bacterium]|jgi:hypothetical protein|nr:hypothetical protein [Prevotellaceae bacterium]
MLKSVTKYVSIAFLLMIYINRGLFVAPAEMSNNPHEINSIAEFLTEIITGQSNNIDEDGDSQETCNMAKIITQIFSPQVSQVSDIVDLSAKITEDFTFPAKENIPPKPLLGTLEQPPQVS